jgi:hypothetical protein
LLISCDRYDDAHDVLFNEYIPLMIELGRGDDRAFSWGSRLVDNCIA